MDYLYLISRIINQQYQNLKYKKIYVIMNLIYYIKISYVYNTYAYMHYTHMYSTGNQIVQNG